jgi:MarR family transcriptional regulator, organic hydroperoxide resistance regulator
MGRVSVTKKLRTVIPPSPAALRDGRRTHGRPDPQGDLFLDIQRTGDRLMRGLEEALRPHKVTPVQYLVLRSLRRAGAGGMPSNEIVREMTTHDPDMTRLLDKLEDRGIIARRRDPDDRRIYLVRLTRDGARVLKALSKVARELHRKQFNTLTKRQAEALARLLDSVNEAPIPDLDEEE